ncbi:hypothetical protein L6Q96_08575 [Candidatus Binatia bacterium]|nr:hypothetical protein [Candidatus Binatia bacterium]
MTERIHSVKSGAQLGLAMAALIVLCACGDNDGAPVPPPQPTPTAVPPRAEIVQPADGLLSVPGDVDVVLRVPPGTAPADVSLTLNGSRVSIPLQATGDELRGVLPAMAAGVYKLGAVLHGGDRGTAAFDLVSLDRPDECEILNSAACLLPYPSSRFLETADTPTGYRLRFPEGGMPKQFSRILSPAPYAALDGFSPTVQILMTFPGGVDPVRSNASRLLPELRTYDDRSLQADSPTILLDVTANPPQRVLHFIETDARATDPDRQVIFLRPGRSLTPGHRYVVAARNLRHADDSAVSAEPVFAALRDGRPSDIPAVNARRAPMESIFAHLAAAGIARGDLVLAFDFVVQSDTGLTSQMLSMRDQAFAWLAEQEQAGARTFTVDRVREFDCSQPGARAWRVVEGTYQVPLFLGRDPMTAPNTPAFLNVDAMGVPERNGFTAPPFTIAIPCSVLTDGPKPPIVLGHGLMGTGRGLVQDVAGSAAFWDFDLVAGATDWRGLSQPDADGDLLGTFIGKVILDLRNFAALPDRLRQGMLNTLVLARMMKKGSFNADPAFVAPGGAGALPGPATEAFYSGGSLGGIMGLMFAALSPDIVNAHIAIPAINFSILLQRATPFLPFQGALELTGVTDAADQALLIGIIHELWVRGESAGYATHITANPLPGTNAKNILMTAAYLDQAVSNQGTEIAARTLGLPSLVGSLQTGLVEIPDVAGPVPSALVTYETGSYRLDNPAHVPFIPPLANLQAEPNRCDPHGFQMVIPAALDQTAEFLSPGGTIRNFCDGRCDGGLSYERPYGLEETCDPLAAE